MPTIEVSDSTRYVCCACGRQFANSGTCDSDPEEPLLDLKNPDVVEMLIQGEKQRWRRLSYPLEVVFGGLGALVVIVLAWLSPLSEIMELAEILVYLSLGGLVAGMAVGYRISRSLWRPRYPHILKSSSLFP